MLIAITLDPGAARTGRDRALLPRAQRAAPHRLGRTRPRNRQRSVGRCRTCARSSRARRAIVAAAHRGDPGAVDAARPARRRRPRPPDSIGVSARSRSRRRSLRRGRERSAPGHRDASGRPRRRARCSTTRSRSPKRSRPWTTSSRSLRSPSSDDNSARGLPGRARRGPEQRLDRAARARPARVAAGRRGTSRSASPGRPRSTSTSPRGSLTFCRSTCSSSSDCRSSSWSWCSGRCWCRSSRPAGFVLSLFATYGAVAAIFQWGWFGDAARHPQPRSDPELPAGHPGRHPVRPRDGLPAVPRLRHARGVRRTARPRGSPSRRASGPAARS